MDHDVYYSVHIYITYILLANKLNKGNFIVSKFCYSFRNYRL